MSTISDESVSHFMAVTGTTDTNKATSYLEMSGGDLETAVGLFMEHEVGSAVSPPAAARGNDATSGDAALAASLMQQDEIRAPDQTRSMRLMDDHNHPMVGGMMDPSMMMMNELMEEQFGNSAFGAPSGLRRILNSAIPSASAAAAADYGAMDEDDDGMHDFMQENSKEMDNDDNDEIDDDDQDDDDEVQVVQPDSSAGAPPRLADMFAPPVHLIHKAGGFQGARASAKDSRRWLLVNIQRDSEFSSHALNRDVWGDELVENLIREGFIFWQTMDTSVEGRTYVQRYAVNDYPHVAIIDPRTGRLLWRKEGWTQENPLSSATFAEMAMDFCSRNSFDRPPQAPKPKFSGTNKVLSAKQSPQQLVHNMSEDDQLKAAMRASMKDIMPGSNSSKLAGSAKTADDDDDDDDIEYIMDDNDDGDDDEENEAEEDTKPAAVDVAKPPSFMDGLLQLSIPDEPSSGGARIQFRMPDGKRVVRKFALDSTVKDVYTFIAHSIPEGDRGQEFVLMAGYPPSDLINDIEKSVEDCKLSGQAITVRWKE